MDTPIAACSAAEQLVVAFLSKDDVSAAAAVDFVVPVAAQDPVAAVSAFDDVALWASEEAVILVTAPDRVFAAAAVDTVVSGPAFECVVSVAAHDGVRAPTTKDTVAMVASVDEIGTRTAVDEVPPVPSADGVVTAAAPYVVVTAKPLYAVSVGVVVADDEVGGGSADDGGRDRLPLDGAVQPDILGNPAAWHHDQVAKSQGRHGVVCGVDRSEGQIVGLKTVRECGIIEVDLEIASSPALMRAARSSSARSAGMRCRGG